MTLHISSIDLHTFVHYVCTCIFFFSRHELACAYSMCTHFSVSLHRHPCLSECVHAFLCVSSQAGGETGKTAPIALLDETRVSANVSTGSLGEILDIITASGCVGSGLGVMCLLVCLSNCLQSGQRALDSSFRTTKS